MQDYIRHVEYFKGVKCCVDGCDEIADYEVVLYDYYPRSKEEFLEQDETCPFLCQKHMEINEENAKGKRSPREITLYPYTNKHEAQGFSKYNLIEEIYK